MRGVWFLGFCCATLAVTSGSPKRYTRQEPICLVYSYDTLTNAMRNVHAHYAGKHAGYSDRNYNEGIVRYSPSEHQNGKPVDFDVDAVRRAMKNGEKKSKRSAGLQPIDLHYGDMLPVHGKRKRSASQDFTKQLRPLDMVFGDMAPIYDESKHKKDNHQHDKSASRNITCTEHTAGEHVNLELPIFLETLLDIKQYFDKIFP